MTVEAITIYVPIFREKLAKLERRGLGRTAEAVRLRRVITRIDGSAPAETAATGYDNEEAA